MIRITIRSFSHEYLSLDHSLQVGANLPVPGILNVTGIEALAGAVCGFAGPKTG
jgi:hypothetical protein